MTATLSESGEYHAIVASTGAVGSYRLFATPGAPTDPEFCTHLPGYE